MDNPLIHIQQLSIGYPNKVICQSINATVKTGDFILLLGANGKGKSTLLRSLAGLQTSLSGEIKINGASIANYPLKALAKQLAFLPSSNQMADGLLVKELLSFSRIPFKTWFQNTNTEDLEVIMKVAKQTDIEALLDQTYNTLSDGQKQKVNIARCLVQETPIILLDEPTAHLDIVNKIQIFELIQQLAQAGKTIICTTHDIRDASKYASQFWMIDNNQVFSASVNNESTTAEDLIAKLF